MGQGRESYAGQMTKIYVHDGSYHYQQHPTGACTRAVMVSRTMVTEDKVFTKANASGQ